MKTHTLKIKQEYFERIISGQKTFEIRKNDRDYQVGDAVVFTPEGSRHDFSKGFDIDAECLIEIERIKIMEKHVFEIVYIFHGGEYGLDNGYCVFGIRNIKEWRDWKKAVDAKESFEKEYVNMFPNDPFINKSPKK